jgi:hypothetical protein
MTTVTRNCEYCNAEFEPARDHQRFCSTKHRVYASRYGADYGKPAQPAGPAGPPADESIAAALQAARNFTPVGIPDHKTVAAIKVSRQAGPDPNLWKVTMPGGSTVAAGRIHQALTSHIGDMIALANKLGAEAGEPHLVLQTRAARKAARK